MESKIKEFERRRKNAIGMEIKNMETVILEKDTSLREAIQKDDEKNTLQR